MSKSASLPAEPYENPQQVLGTPAWKHEVNQRLAAHRTRRGATEEAAGQGSRIGKDKTGTDKTGNDKASSDRAAAAAARVAARYAKAPSYSELLAGEARAVVRAAGAAAVAARNAQAAAQAVLEGLESVFEPAQGPQRVEEPYWEAAAPHAAVVQAPPAAAPRWQDEPPAAAVAQPRWHEEAAPASNAEASAGGDVWSEMRVYPRVEQEYRRDREQAPTYKPRGAQEYGSGYASGHAAEETGLPAGDAYASAVVEPVQHLPANLIEFPRELVAARKSRPRLAEGPLYEPALEEAQLNIFEVDPLEFSGKSAGAVAPPGWASIQLNHAPLEAHLGTAPELQAYTRVPEMLSGIVENRSAEDESAREELGGPIQDFEIQGFMAAPFARASVAEASYLSAPAAALSGAAYATAKAASSVAAVATQAGAQELMVAPCNDRLLAAIVDGALVALAFLASAVVVIASTSHPPAGRMALIASACGLVLFWVLYQFLFLSYTEEGTPGMRYARVALCTFEDENPTVSQMRMRIPAVILSALPLGLGVVWALWDGDKLGWQDRWTRTYQRKY